MSLAKETPYVALPTDHEDNFYACAYEQAELLRLRRFSQLDLADLVEEVESMRASIGMLFVQVIAC